MRTLSAPGTPLLLTITLGCVHGSIEGSPSDGAPVAAGSTGRNDAASADGGEHMGSGGAFPVDPDSLRARVSEELAFVGAAIDVTALNAEENYRNLVAKELNSVTPENVMKWGPLEPEPGR